MFQNLLLFLKRELSSLCIGISLNVWGRCTKGVGKNTREWERPTH